MSANIRQKRKKINGQPEGRSSKFPEIEKKVVQNGLSKAGEQDLQRRSKRKGRCISTAASR